MPLTLSGNGTISGLVAGGLPDGTITGSDLASGAATSNLGYTPLNRQGGIYYASGAEFTSGTSSVLLDVPGRKTWFKYVNPNNNSGRYLHIKTNYFIGYDGFWSVKGYGYHYGRAMTINSQWVGYCYSNSGGSGVHTLISTNVSNYGQHALASNSYRSSDQYVVIVADISAASNTYYITFELDFYQARNDLPGAAITHTAASISNSTTGVY